MKILKTIILSIISILFLNTVNAQKEHKAYYDNGNIKEEGQFDTDGKGTGNWKFYSEDGTLRYTGSYEKGSPNGEFKFYNQLGWLNDIVDYKNGKKISLSKGCYSGDCENGYGKKYLGSDKRQEGNFTNGLLNGKGTEINTNSGVTNYEGNFLNGEKDGQGIETVDALHSKYVGQWKQGKKNGEGTLTQYNFLLGGILMEKYVGNWVNGKKAGQATIIEYGSHGKIEKRKLIGIWNWNENNVVIKQGRWVDDVFYPNLTIEKKYSKNEKCTVGNCIDGFGIFIETFEPGWNDAYRDYVNTYKIKYEGFWIDGKFHGLGYAVDRMNRSFVGQFEKGKAIK